MKLFALITTLLMASVSYGYNSCVLIAANSAQRSVFSHFGYIPGFTNGCLVVQQDTNVVYEWNGSAYISIGGPGAGIMSLNSQTGATQIFANDANIAVSSSNNTHTLGWASTLSMARGGSGAALTAANGGVIYSSASAMVVLPAGTSGQTLRSGGAAAPTWGGDVGITSLNAQVGVTQVFSNDANVVITSSSNTHALGWSGTLSAARGGTGLGVGAAGTIIYSSGSAWVALPAGTSGQTLKSGGAGAPTWQ